MGNFQYSVATQMNNNNIQFHQTDALKRSPLFASLSKIQLDRVCSHSRNVELAESQPLFNQGEEADYFYLVQRGRIQLFRTSADGQDKIIEIFKPGEVFAEALAFAERPRYPVSAAALEQTEVIGINIQDYKAILWDSPATCFSLLGDMSLRLHKLIHEIDTLSLHNGSCRVASYLINSADDNVRTFRLDLAKNLIASRLAVQPETFSRIIARLRKQGIVEIDGDYVTIIDRDALKKLSMI